MRARITTLLPELFRWHLLGGDVEHDVPCACTTVFVFISGGVKRRGSIHAEHQCAVRDQIGPISSGNRNGRVASAKLAPIMVLAISTLPHPYKPQGLSCVGFSRHARVNAGINRATHIQNDTQ